MFLGSCDLRNALLTVSKLTVAYKELNILLNDDIDIHTVRNVLLVFIMLSDDFDADNPSDIDYIWSVWYSLLWTEDVRKRFLKDVGQLLSHQWAENGTINISDQESIDILKKILYSWQKMASQDLADLQGKADKAVSIMAER